MGNTNIKLTVHVPSLKRIKDKVTFTPAPAAQTDGLRIPLRYPFADIANYTQLVTDGVFRHEVGLVEGSAFPEANVDDLGASNQAGTDAKWGYQLPNVVNLTLLIKKGDAGEETFTLSGNKFAGFAPEVVTVPAGAIGDIVELDLYQLGTSLVTGSSVERGVTFTNCSTTLSFALIARQ